MKRGFSAKDITAGYHESKTDKFLNTIFKTLSRIGQL